MIRDTILQFQPKGLFPYVKLVQFSFRLSLAFLFHFSLDLVISMLAISHFFSTKSVLARVSQLGVHSTRHPHHSPRPARIMAKMTSRSVYHHARSFPQISAFPPKETPTWQLWLLNVSRTLNTRIVRPWSLELLGGSGLVGISSHNPLELN